jgi:hypothetical protein
LSDSTGNSPVKLIFDRSIPGVFETFLKKRSEQKPPVESLQERVRKPQVKIKEKAAK